MAVNEIVVDKTTKPKIYDMENYKLIPGNLVELYKQKGVTKREALKILERSFEDNEITEETRNQTINQINEIFTKKAS